MQYLVAHQETSKYHVKKQDEVGEMPLNKLSDFEVIKHDAKPNR